MQNYIRKNWSTLLLSGFLLLMLLPQTRQPIQVFIQRMIALSPNTLSQEEQNRLMDDNMAYENDKGDILNLSNHKGKVVLINFWATWCPPCIAEMPSFKKLYADYGDKITFLFITQDDWDVVHEFEQKRAYQLPYYKLRSTPAQLKHRQLPTTYLIDKKGNIVLEHVGVADWNSPSLREELDMYIQN